MNQYPNDFLRFWQVYPRKVGKRPAYRAWQREIKVASAEQIIQAAFTFAKHEALRGAEKVFIPHPTTWLNQARYQDEYDEADFLGPIERSVLDAIGTESSGDVCRQVDELLSICSADGEAKS